MNFSLQEVDHLLLALEKLPSYDQAQIREGIRVGGDHKELVQKLKTYRLRLT